MKFFFKKKTGSWWLILEKKTTADCLWMELYRLWWCARVIDYLITQHPSGHTPLREKRRLKINTAKRSLQTTSSKSGKIPDCFTRLGDSLPMTNRHWSEGGRPFKGKDSLRLWHNRNNALQLEMLARGNGITTEKKDDVTKPISDILTPMTSSHRAGYVAVIQRNSGQDKRIFFVFSKEWFVQQEKGIIFFFVYIVCWPFLLLL